MSTIRSSLLHIVFVGDIHGNFKKLFRTIKNQNINNSNIILCGDIGVGFKNWSNKLRNAVRYSDSKVFNNRFFGIRGNHDDPSFFRNTRIKIDNFKLTLVEDYSKIVTPTKSILCIGGAWSRDYKSRVESIDWWKDEVPIYNQYRLIRLIPKINILVTHACPSEACKDVLSLNSASELDPDLIREKEALFFNQIKHCINRFRNIKIDWIYGHHHRNKLDSIENINYYGLGECQLIKLN